METKTLTQGITMQVLPQENNVVDSMSMEREETEIFNLPTVENEQTENNQTESPKSIADQVLQSAKDEGFEEALTHLANGDFEEKRTENEFQELVTNEATIVQEPLIPTESEFEMEFYKEKVRTLEAEKKVQLEVNKDLLQRVKKMEHEQAVTIFTLAEIIRMYEEMIEEAPNHKEKAGLLETLIQALVDLFATLTNSNGEEKEDEVEKQDVEKKEPISFEQFRKMIEAPIT